MPENEFEKQVKELMESLHFSPSEPVWEKIKKGIAEKKRRLWPIIFLFITIAFFGGYWFYSAKQSAKTISSYKQPGKIKTEKKLPNNNKKESNAQKKNIITQEDSLRKNNSTKSNIPAFAKASSKKENPVTQKQSLIKRNNTQENNNAIVSKKQSSAQPFATTDNNSETKNQNNEITNTPALKNSVTNSQTSKTNNAENIDAANQIKIDSVNNITKFSKSNIDTTNTIAANAKQSHNKKNIQSNNSKWLFGVSAMYGNSNISNRLFSLNNKKSLQYAVNSGVGPYNSNTAEDPYNVQHAYNFGITVQRKILKHSYISTGLNFVHLSSKSYAALNLDSSLVLISSADFSFNSTGNFYRAGSEKTYINNFNFIELPLAFQSNIFHTKNFGLLYDAGFSVMQLLSSNTLIYNNKTNSYFTNDDLLRHTQFQITGGLNLQLNTNHAGMFLLGPQFKYSLTPDVKNKDYNRFHFMNYGIQASWLFHKKN